MFCTLFKGLVKNNFRHLHRLGGNYLILKMSEFKLELSEHDLIKFSLNNLVKT